MTTLNFSNWAMWDNRLTCLNDLDHPGIYALLISESALEGTSFEWKKDIAYFGMTNSAAGLKGRLSQFNNTLRNINGPGHGGAERFRYDYPDGEGLAKKLFVAVCPFRRNGREVTPDNLLVYGQVAMAEYIAFAEYLKRFGSLPKYNDKKASPKQKDLTLRSSGPAQEAAQSA